MARGTETEQSEGVNGGRRAEERRGDLNVGIRSGRGREAEEEEEEERRRGEREVKRGGEEGRDGV